MVIDATQNPAAPAVHVRYISDGLQHHLGLPLVIAPTKPDPTVPTPVVNAPKNAPPPLSAQVGEQLVNLDALLPRRPPQRFQNLPHLSPQPRPPSPPQLPQKPPFLLAMPPMMRTIRL